MGITNKVDRISLLVEDAMRYKNTVKFCSDLIEIKKHINHELSQFSKLIDNEELMFDLRLILNELLINAGEHGNKWSQEKCINYEIICDDDYIQIHVKDEGKGISELKPFDGSSLASSGRGLKIVKELTDEFIIDRNQIIVKIFI